MSTTMRTYKIETAFTKAVDGQDDHVTTEHIFEGDGEHDTEEIAFFEELHDARVALVTLSPGHRKRAERLLSDDKAPPNLSQASAIAWAITETADK